MVVQFCQEQEPPIETNVENEASRNRQTEAEAVAYVVSKAVGLTLTTKSADYIQLWSGDETLLLQSLELIRDVASHIIKELDTEVECNLLQVA